MQTVVVSICLMNRPARMVNPNLFSGRMDCAGQLSVNISAMADMQDRDQVVGIIDLIDHSV
jgi:hypothetical protein